LCRQGGGHITPCLCLKTGSNLPCFVGGPDVTPALRQRFCMNMTEKQLEAHVNYMIDQSLDAFSTKMYDNYQVRKGRVYGRIYMNSCASAALFAFLKERATHAPLLRTNVCLFYSQLHGPQQSRLNILRCTYESGGVCFAPDLLNQCADIALSPTRSTTLMGSCSWIEGQRSTRAPG
jgi:hypothetical protein